MQIFLKKINPTYFWDIDLDKIEDQKSKRLIIERILNLGNLQEIKQMISHYGKEEVIETMCNLNHLDPKTLNFFSLVFGISKTKFKCYTRKQSINQHWIY
ncbi:MAG: hypothetical protein H8E34_11550 [Bacteroidetes bacterium]|nr:hypothetical protein [Bacteroidota bacterium]